MPVSDLDVISFLRGVTAVCGFKEGERDWKQSSLNEPKWDDSDLLQKMDDHIV